MPLRITTWNVNGIRNPFGYQPWRDTKTFDGMFEVLQADIVVMQELKIQGKDLRDDMVLVPGWDCYFSLPRHKKGYSGVGIYTRNSTCAPIRAEEGVLGVLCPPNSSTPYCELPTDQHIGGYLSLEQLVEVGVDAAELDAEGRCVVLEFPAFVLFGIYSPANSSGDRDDFRYGFLCALDARIRNLVAEGKRVIVTGDLNVSRSEIDTANIADRLKKEGITHQDYISMPNRRVFNQLIEGGEFSGERDEGREKPVLWDICRGFHPTRTGMFTHWEQKINARPGNYGSRIDYVLCSVDMKPWFCESDIQEGLMGSDHCPVYAVMKDQVNFDGEDKHIHDIMNPEGMFQNGKRLREHTLKDICAFSAKLLPNFNKRRSIKDMFGKKQLPLETVPEVPHDASDSGLDVESMVAIELTKPHGEESNGRESSGPSKPYVGMPAGSQTHARAQSATVSPERKRKTSGPAPQALTKRSRSNTSTLSTSPGKGQQSLKGFFSSKSSLQNASSHTNQIKSDNGEEEGTQETDSKGESESFESGEKTDSEVKVSPEDVTEVANLGYMVSTHSDTVIDPIVSKESWSKLFSKPMAPRCESHNEPCITMTTKKAGINCGRSFWMCSRPLGPTGQKERNTQWRCPTFIWHSDWNTNGEQKISG